MEQAAEKKDHLLKRPIRFLFKWRSFYPYELVCYVLMYAGATLFAYATLPPAGIPPYTPSLLRILLLSILTLYSGFFAALIWNDITDKDIDQVVHPTRPIPDGRISQSRFFAIALLFSAMTFLFAVLTSPWCLILVGMTALFVTFHNKYLKKKIHLPAYSEIFTPVQWLTVPLFGFFAMWTALPATGDSTITVPVLGYLSLHSTQLVPLLLLVLFTYFADDAHDLAEGIHDVEGDRLQRVNTYATSFGTAVAAKVSCAMIIISGIFGILLWYTTLLSLLFLVPFLILWVYTLRSFFKLVSVKDDLQGKQLAKLMGKKGYDYLLLSYVILFCDVSFQLVNAYSLHWVIGLL
ncbi:MAG: UbiA family prenyltransferase [Candidatus Thermoplasmatota archaeon]|nr:UbiA family prenyltransferase [Candidatus Thermoplasmatota archaeon]